MDELALKANLARHASYSLSQTPNPIRQRALQSMANAIMSHKKEIIDANNMDVEEYKSKFPNSPLIDRLALSESRISEASEGLMKVSALPDPIGEVVAGWETDSGLQIKKVRVPLGVIGAIYESRPNVTIDIAGLAVKSGNAVILRGGSEAVRSNAAIGKVLQESLNGIIDKNAVQVIEDPDRSIVDRMIKLRGIIDIIVPRGSSKFIDYIVNNSTVPVIETGAGNNHIFVNSDADFEMATNIIVNAKVQRPAVCNAVRKVLVHKKIAEEYLPKLVSEMKKYGVRIKGDETSIKIDPTIEPASSEDWDTEYLDLTLAIKVVNSVEEAVKHINAHGTKHSEAIITENLSDAEYFTCNVDAACTYVNASIRFTDGEQFGFGAEVGISTQKLHARGPMGIKELTTTKYIIYGNGQVREI
ncbi:MAG: glutamate-5-semialdehyde dehydrogenase [Conexivisphaerales archaeon]